MFVDRVFIRVVETRGAYEAVIKEVVTSSCVVFEGERRKETGFRFCNDIPFITRDIPAFLTFLRRLRDSFIAREFIYFKIYSPRVRKFVRASTRQIFHAYVITL